MSDIPVDDRPLSLDERKALNWYREHGPADVGAYGSPDKVLRIALARRGLIGIAQNRRRFDPIAYEITERGREVLRG